MPLLFDAATSIFEDVKERQARGGDNLMGLPTGFRDLDYAIGGWRLDNMYTLGGPSGAGKTAAAVSMAIETCKAGHTIVYVSLEMSAGLMALRILSGETGIPALRLERGKIEDHQVKQVAEAVERLQDYKFHVLDNSYTSKKLMETAYEYKDKDELDFLVVDYASLLRSEPGVSLYEKETQISLDMREIARVAQIPVLTLVQLNRNRVGRDNKKPVISDIKQTGGYEQDSSAVMFIHRPYVDKMQIEGAPALDKEEDALILLAKNRHGPANIELNVDFYPKQMRWADKVLDDTPPPHPAKRKDD